MRKRVGDSNSFKPSVGAHDVMDRKVNDSVRSTLWWLCKMSLFTVCVISIAVPFMLRLCPDLLTQVVYSHRGAFTPSYMIQHSRKKSELSYSHSLKFCLYDSVRVPFFVDLNQPGDLSLNHTVNNYLTSEEGISLGVWHTVPENQWKEAQGKDVTWYQKSLGDGSPIFIYLHGNGGTRAAPHRVGVANVLSGIGYHVLAPDYRGFGDSTGEPTEVGLTVDVLYLYNWVKERSGSSLVIIWGHSLGTGVTTNTAVKLMEQGVIVDGVILEGAFTNIRQEGAHHPFSWYYWKFPGFEYFFLDSMEHNNIVFPSDENLKKMRSPLLILHAEDDHIVPLHMAQELYQIALRAPNSENKVKMFSFSGTLGYLHNGLYKDPQLPNILREFVLSLSLK